jgi:hypothetical protein
LPVAANTQQNMFDTAATFLYDTDEEPPPTENHETFEDAVEDIPIGDEPYEGADFATVMDPTQKRFTHEITVDNKYHAGNTILRNTRVTERVQTDATGIEKEGDVTIECATCPFLFPNGKGWNNGKVKSMSMTNYLNMRVFQLFSPFTLINVYVMIMFQLFQACKLTSRVKETMLERSLHRYVKENPDRTYNDAMKDVVKRLVPAKLVGSSQYHRQALQDLLAIRDVFGMPALFLTLTTDETSEFRWEEIDDLEKFMERFENAPNTWKKAPVECARLFHDRTTAFMKDYILPG